MEFNNNDNSDPVRSDEDGNDNSETGDITFR